MTRRRLLQAGATGTALLAVGGAPAFARTRPGLTHGVQSGDVTTRSGVVGARADRPSRMVVEFSRTESFAGARRVDGPILTASTDFTGKQALRDLRAGTEHFYRVTLEDLLDPGLTSEPLTGSFATAPARAQDVSFVWGADIAGQGYGINPDIGGYRIFSAMGATEPRFFLCSGDHIYADNPLSPTVTLPDGRVWRNVTTDAKAKVAETLAEFRGNFAYNLLDDNLRAFAARVPQVNQWDDHEVRNNWYRGQVLTDPRYRERRIDVLAARARRAFFEYLPIGPTRGDRNGRVYRRIGYGPLLDVFVLDMRTFKDPNDDNRGPTGRVLGDVQRAWLKHALARSTATWKVIANSLPIGLVVPDGAAFEGVAQGDPGAPQGREHEIADVLRFAKRRGVTGMVFVTADVHYTAAHRYDPARAAFQEFDPFWEFVAGPLNAGAFGPNPLDGTFGPEVVFQSVTPAPNTSPLDGHQYFGHVAIDAGTRAMTVSLRDIDGATVHATTLEAPAG
jgi:alkaline phosphatase D